MEEIFHEKELIDVLIVYNKWNKDFKTKELNNPDIILKPLEKESGLVLMNKSNYQDFLVINGHLNSNVY